MKKCLHFKIEVSGKVQGVWFRKYTQEKAELLDIKGFVMNLPDGKVYIEAESNDPDKLQILLDWLHQGSPLSKVSEVKLLHKKECIGYNNFQIRK